MGKTIATVCAGLILAAAVGPTSARARDASSEPARMIEVRPGLWVGSYQCVTDLERGGRDCSSGI